MLTFPKRITQFIHNSISPFHIVPNTKVGNCYPQEIVRRNEENLQSLFIKCVASTENPSQSEEYTPRELHEMRVSLMNARPKLREVYKKSILTALINNQDKITTFEHFKTALRITLKHIMGFAYAFEGVKKKDLVNNVISFLAQDSMKKFISKMAEKLNISSEQLRHATMLAIPKQYQEIDTLYTNPKQAQEAHIRMYNFKMDFIKNSDGEEKYTTKDEYVQDNCSQYIQAPIDLIDYDKNCHASTLGASRRLEFHPLIGFRRGLKYTDDVMQKDVLEKYGYILQEYDTSKTIESQLSADFNYIIVLKDKTNTGIHSFQYAYCGDIQRVISKNGYCTEAEFAFPQDVIDRYNKRSKCELKVEIYSSAR